MAPAYMTSGFERRQLQPQGTANSFRTYQQKGVVVDISRNFRVDVKLTVGKETETVTVEPMPWQSG